MSYPDGGVVVATTLLTVVHSGRWAVPHRPSASPPSSSAVSVYSVDSSCDRSLCLSVGQSVSPPVVTTTVVRYVLRASVGSGVFVLVVRR